MNKLEMNAAQHLLLNIGGTAAGAAFGINRDNQAGLKRGYTKSPKKKPRK